MRIAMFSEVPTFNPALPNGISSFIEAVSQELVKLGHEVHIFEPSLYIGQKKEIRMKENLIKHNLFITNDFFLNQVKIICVFKPPARA